MTIRSQQFEAARLFSDHRLSRLLWLPVLLLASLAMSPAHAHMKGMYATKAEA